MALEWLASLPWAAIASGECVPDLEFEEYARERDDVEGTHPSPSPSPSPTVTLTLTLP